MGILHAAPQGTRVSHSAVGRNSCTYSPVTRAETRITTNVQVVVTRFSMGNIELQFWRHHDGCQLAVSPCSLGVDTLSTNDTCATCVSRSSRRWRPQQLRPRALPPPQPTLRMLRTRTRCWRICARCCSSWCRHRTTGSL